VDETNLLALDIGGANTKISYEDNGRIIYKRYYFPFWKYREKFHRFLRKIIPKKVDMAGITMTAELSDAFYTREEGVDFILNSVENIAKDIFVLTNEGKLIDTENARKNKEKIASANWIAPALYLADKYDSGILIDTGSTTTDIIPVKEGIVIAKGRSDLERLQYNELLYTGVLRTNVATIVKSLIVNNKITRVSSEFFASTGDVYRILGHISEKEYSCETADGRGKSRVECMARLCRVVCSDINSLGVDKIECIAAYIKKKQIMEIAENIRIVAKRTGLNKAFISGIGRFIAKESAKKTKIKEIRKINRNPAKALLWMLNKKG